MPAFGEAAEEVAQMITAAGVPAVVDARDLNLPGAWVTPNSFNFDYMATDTFEASWDIYLIAGDNGTTASLNDLSKMLAALQIPLGITEALPVSLTLANHSPEPLPGLLVKLETKVSA